MIYMIKKPKTFYNIKMAPIGNLILLGNLKIKLINDKIGIKQSKDSSYKLNPHF